MKKFIIAVMVLDFSDDYSLEISAGITDYFKGKNVNVLISQVRLPELPYGTYEYQYWAGKSLFASRSIDAVIVVSSFFTTSVSVSQFANYLRNMSEKPVVSIGVKLPFEKSCCTKTDSLGAYREVINHLVSKHGCKRIAFMSANKTISEEGRERFEAYKKSLSENNLEFDPSLVFDGDFTIPSAEDALSIFKSKDDLTFDAILAANDLMAIGCYNVLTKLGILIPEDVKVIGFDDSYRAMNIEPTLSTISQQIYNQGQVAADLVFKAVTGKPYEKETLIPLKPMYRQSCGCVDALDFDLNYVDSDGNKTPLEKFSYNKTVSEFIKNSDDKRNIYFLLDVLQMSESLSDLLTRFRQILYTIDIRRIALCLFDEPILNRRGDEFIIPNEVELAIVLDREHNVEVISPKIRFNPNEKLIPNGFFEDDYDEYIMEAVFYGEKQYGYALFKLGKKNYPLGNIYIKAIANAIANAYEFSRKQIENKNLSTLNESLVNNNTKLNATSKIDDLTQSFNRRGFLAAGKQILDLSRSMSRGGIVVFCDMDNLRGINSEYGHDMGDNAIKAVVEALKRTFTLNDVIGRISGDEFAIISANVTIDQFPEIYSSILENCNDVAEESGYKFQISVSAGAAEYTNNDTDLQTLLNIADGEQYKEKKRKRDNIKKGINIGA